MQSKLIRIRGLVIHKTTKKKNQKQKKKLHEKERLYKLAIRKYKTKIYHRI